jgi:hypothetical protein
MGENPKGDWNINQVRTVCSHYSVDCEPPGGGGSHWKVSSAHLEGILTIPAGRPIKPIYIRKLVSYMAAHIEIDEEKNHE